MLPLPVSELLAESPRNPSSTAQEAAYPSWQRTTHPVGELVAYSNEDGIDNVDELLTEFRSLDRASLLEVFDVQSSSCGTRTKVSDHLWTT